MALIQQQQMQLMMVCEYKEAYHINKAIYDQGQSTGWKGVGGHSLFFGLVPVIT